MKILCLHGMGTNADIFKAQTASFRSLLPSHFQFDFLEGENDCSAADGIADIYRGPYTCWYPSPPTLDRVADAHEMVQEIIDEDGPFDGVMGFSQGAALAASILLHREIESPLEPPPFRFAVFICGSLPFSSSERYGFDLSNVFNRLSDPLPAGVEEWKRLANGVSMTDKSDSAVLRPVDQSLSTSHHIADCAGRIEGFVPDDSLSDAESYVESPETPATPQSLFKDGKASWGSSAISSEQAIEKLALSAVSSAPVHRFHPALDAARISIPTAHIYGKNDLYLEQSLQLIQLCQQDRIHVLDHGGAHEIPRSANVGRAIARLVEKTVTKSEFML